MSLADAFLALGIFCGVLAVALSAYALVILAVILAESALEEVNIMRFFIRALIGALTTAIIGMIARHLTKKPKNDYLR